MSPKADPVGYAEIAERLGVKPETVRQWKWKDPSFPEPSLVIGGHPAWSWSKVRRWAKETGRLDR